MIIDKALLDSLFKQAADTPRLRQNHDMRTSPNDSSQRMLNALLPGTQVPIHRHPNSSENVICLSGSIDEVIYEETEEHTPGAYGSEQGMEAQDIRCGTVLREQERIHLSPAEGLFGCTIPAGAWHSVEVFEPSVIYEAKDGKYGEDGSETCGSLPHRTTPLPRNP
ncbi:MAG: cupin fold metalloprotein, WbuC family [Bacteroidaceae bacterium]|nr:cupin fold metalloprotein, WbuC family [Bacteroidaceae bacterium]